MQRRTLLALAGVSIPTALAGCTTSEDPEYETGTGDSDDSDGDGGGDESPSDDDITIAEHDLVVEDDDYVEEVTIEGIVENNSDEMVRYVEVTARVYDADGNQLDSYIDNTSDLDAGRSWSFEIMLLEESDEIDDYDIAVEDISW